MSDREPRSRDVRAWIATCVAASSIFLYVVDAGLVALSLPAIEREFSDVPRSTIGWVAGGFLVAQASLLLVGGRIGDRNGRKRWFLAGLLCFSLGAASTALAPSVWWLIASRVVQGAGAAFLTAGALALVLPMFPRGRAAVIIGVWGAIGSVAAWLTPTAGALLVERNWRFGFAVVAPIGLVAFFAGRRVLTEQPPDRSAGPTDRLAYVFGPPALGLAMLVLSRGSTWGWGSAATLTLGSIAVALLGAFAWRTAVAASPLVDLEIVLNRSFRANVAAGLLQQMGFFGWFFTAPIVMSGVWGWSVREIGLALALSQILASLGAPLGGQLVVRVGSPFPIVLGAACIVLGVTWFAITMSADADPWRSFAPMALLLGFGSGMCGTVTNSAALSTLPDRLLGAGNSVVQLVRRMGGALGVALAVALLGDASGEALLTGGRRVAWFVVVAHSLIVVVLWVEGRRTRRPSEPALRGRYSFRS